MGWCFHKLFFKLYVSLDDISIKKINKLYRKTKYEIKKPKLNNKNMANQKNDFKIPKGQLITQTFTLKKNLKKYYRYLIK